MDKFDESICDTGILAVAAQIPSSTRQERSQRRQMHFQTAGLQRKGATRIRLKNHAEEQLGCIEFPTIYRTDRIGQKPIRVQVQSVETCWYSEIIHRT